MRDIPFMLVKLREGTTAPEIQPDVAEAFEEQSERIEGLEADVRRMRDALLRAYVLAVNMIVSGQGGETIGVRWWEDVQAIAKHGLFDESKR